MNKSVACLALCLLLALSWSIAECEALNAKILDRDFEAMQMRKQKKVEDQEGDLALQGDDPSPGGGAAAGAGGGAGAGGAGAGSPGSAGGAPVLPTPDGANDQSKTAMQNLAGMGITVVLRNRNHIRTIQDKSAARAGQEEAKKQMSMEQQRKEARKRQDDLEAEKRRKMEQLEDKSDQEKAEANRKARTEQDLKRAAKDAQDRQDRIDEQKKKAEERREAETRAREQKQEQEDKERAREREQKQEQRAKTAENEQKGSIKIDAVDTAQGRVLADNSRVPFTGAYTYMFWVYPKNDQPVPYWANIMHKGQQDINRSPAVWFYPGQFRLHVRSASSTNWWAGGNNGCDPTTPLTPRQWTHVAFSHSSSGITVYFNGDVVCTSNYGGPVSNEGPVYIGNPWYNPAAVKLADFRYLPRVVEASEIQKAVSDRRGLQ